MNTVTITNPGSGESVAYCTDGATEAQCAACAVLLSDVEADALHGIAVTPGEWLAAMVDIIGPVRAGQIILGS